ncbi:MAG: T9SS type A sorting domain-containing protein [Bacteroidales bacterium]|nr:T9SS type A sorting domain-containing protein [Bacteroidales bacterium]
MKLNFTLSNTLKKVLKARNIFGVFLLSAIFIAGCYEFSHVGQPEEAYTNSSFEVQLIAHEDDGENDFTVEGLQDIGLFGVLIPEGWTVEDSIYYQIVSEQEEHNNDGYLLYNEDNSLMLEDSIGSTEDYYWWGAATDREADMMYFDSLYFSPKILTDEKTGTFYLRYAIGDVDYWDRYPADDVTDPQAITIKSSAGIFDNEVEDFFTVYPNPSTGKFTLNLQEYKGEKFSLEVYDLTGNRIMVKENVNDRTIVDLNAMAKGIYLVKLSQENSLVGAKRIIIE